MADLRWDRAFALEQSCDDEEILSELIETMKRSAAKDFALIKDGMQAQDAEAVERPAHSMKGAAASLGFEGIREITMAIEYAAKKGDLGLEEKVGELGDLIGLLNEVS